MQLRTARLALLPGTPERLSAHLQGPRALAAQLGASLPRQWPMDAFDQQRVESFISHHDDGLCDGIGLWYMLVRMPMIVGEGSILVGICGFDRVETDQEALNLICSVIPDFRQRRMASEASAALIGDAFNERGAGRILATASRSHQPSQKLLDRLGFQKLAGASDADAMRYQLTYEAWSARCAPPVLETA